MEENGKYTIRGKQKYIWPCFCGSWELAIYLLVGKQQTWSQRQSCCIFVWDGSQQSWFNWEPQKLHGLDYSVPERVVGHDVLQKGWNNMRSQNFPHGKLLEIIVRDLTNCKWVSS